VLLSPGAPSGDDFADFQVRGDAFRALVAEIGVSG
jgi:UDP-N-acetylmuramoylalanine-D-glutamate ligase